jgi:hypothetical protein
MFIVSERFGGWGFLARLDEDLDEPRRLQGRLTRVWSTEDLFKVPESVLFDGKRNVLYVSNFNKLRGGDIYRFRKGRFDTWKTGHELHRANGLFYHNGNIIVGNSGDGFLKSVSVVNGRVDGITCLGAGVIDGIRVDDEGNYIVSQWEGRIYLVSPDGLVSEIVDTGKEGLNTADLEYIAEDRLLVVPTFLGNKVVAYRLEAE